MSKKSKYLIIFACESKEDHEGLVKAISKYKSITWNNDTVESTIEREDDVVFRISKSAVKPPNIKL